MALVSCFGLVTLNSVQPFVLDIQLVCDILFVVF